MRTAPFNPDLALEKLPVRSLEGYTTTFKASSKVLFPTFKVGPWRFHELPGEATFKAPTSILQDCQINAYTTKTQHPLTRPPSPPG